MAGSTEMDKVETLDCLNKVWFGIRNWRMCSDRLVSDVRRFSVGPEMTKRYRVTTHACYL